MSRTDNTGEIEHQRFLATLAAPIAGALALALEKDRALARALGHSIGGVDHDQIAEIASGAVLIAEAIWRRVST